MFNHSIRLLGFAMVIAVLSTGFIVPNVWGDDDGNEFTVKFDMNDRFATVDGDDAGSGVARVDGNNVDFVIKAHNLTPNQPYEVMVLIRDVVGGVPVPQADGMAVVSFPTPSDEDGRLRFRKKNFNLELLHPGTYRLDWMVSLPGAAQGAGTGADGMALAARLGRDPLLACAPGTVLVVGGDDGGDDDD